MTRRLALITKVTVIALLIFLPYYIFEGKIQLGGDDTRLLYAYPWLYVKNVAYFSWFNVSTIGINASNQYTLPFLTIWTVMGALIKNQVVLMYLAFSTPMILGFIYFQKFAAELFGFKENDSVLIIGSLLYILSPILITNQYFIFLTPVWLIGLIPIVGYYFLRYQKTSDFKHVYFGMIWCVLLSLCLIGIPWILGVLLPLSVGMIVFLIFYPKKKIIQFVKKSFIFFSIIFFTQAYWIIGFLAPTLLSDANSFVSKYGSSEFSTTFAPTVTSTATGSVFYPLIGLFHRQIAFDFEWQLKNIFLGFYDHTFILNTLLLGVIAVGILTRKSYNNKDLRIKFLFTLSVFITSLYLFTVNIGPLLDLFLLLGKVPGFIMFRNFYDKFALGYTLSFALLFTVSLFLFRQRFPKNFALTSIVLVVIIIINFLPIKSTVNSPLWTTKSIYRTLIVPEEYIDFMNIISSEVSSTNTILSVPVGSALYTAIKDQTSNNAYLGVSPVKIFSGVNDISGYLSFNFTDEGLDFDNHIVYRRYNELNTILEKWNINYIILTKNLPREVLDSYGFGKDTLKAQDQQFLDSVTGELLFTSKEGNYELYSTKKRNSIFGSDQIMFKKISPVKYSLYISNIEKPKKLIFRDSYYSGWKLYVEENPSKDFCDNIIYEGENKIVECKESHKFFDIEDLMYTFKKSEFEESHINYLKTQNAWTIDPVSIKNEFPKGNYKTNKDGSIDIELVLYFKPQNYLYIGAIVSIITITGSTLYLFFRRKNEKK